MLRIKEGRGVNTYLRKLIEENEFIYVNPRYDYRGSLVHFLSSHHGFKARAGEENSWENVRDSVFPIGLDIAKKEYFCLQSVESSNEAAKAGLIVTDLAIYEYFGVQVSMRFDEYREKVKEFFRHYGYMEEEIEEYFSEAQTLEVLITGYEQYTRFGSAAYYPVALASCLDMLY